MYHIVYMSRATRNLSTQELNDLCEHSADSNRKLRVTGLLVYDGHRYMQVIEGDADIVKGLMQRIACDNRHDHISYMADSPLKERAFAAWSLACVGFGPNDIAASLLTDVKYRVRNIGDRDLMASFIGFAALAR
jgi:hypothetical protein